MTQTQNHLPWVPRAQLGQGRSSQALTRAPNPAACVHPSPGSPPDLRPHLELLRDPRPPCPRSSHCRPQCGGAGWLPRQFWGARRAQGCPLCLLPLSMSGNLDQRGAAHAVTPPTSSLPPPSRLGQDGPQTGPGSGSAQHPLPARKVTPETFFGHRSSHWSWAGALRRDSGTERRRDGDRACLSNQSPSQTMPHRATATIPGHGAPTRLQVGRLQPPAAPCPPWLSPHSTWLCSENSSGVILAAKNRQTEQAGGALPPAPSPAVPGGSHGPSQPGPPRKAGAQGYLAEGCKLQPEAQLGHGGRRVPSRRWQQLPHDHGRLSLPAPSPQPARPHLHVGLVTACAYFP